MITSAQCLARYGDPRKEAAMTLWDVPEDLEIGVIPKKIYCNLDLVEPLTNAFKNLIKTGFVAELKTWDGCFNIRQKKGDTSPSLHSWGLAVDVNAAWNGFSRPTSLSEGFVRCFTEAGFDWGGLWKRKDGMHFQLSKFPDEAI